MINITIVWMVLLFFVGFIIYLLLKLDCFLVLGVVFILVDYVLYIFLDLFFVNI